MRVCFCEMMWCRLIFMVLPCTFVLSVERLDYKRYTVYEIFPKTEEQAYILQNLSANDKYDFGILPRGANVTAKALVSSNDQQDFETNLKIEGISFNFTDYVTMINNSTLMDIAFIQPEFNRHFRYEEILLYLNTLTLLYPSKVTVKTEGESSEGRKIKSIRISNGDRMPNKKVIFITAGSQGSEWIGPDTALYIIYQLVEKANEHAYLLRDFDWIILPVVNPDGYEYSLESDHFWSKTRRRINGKCFGTNVDRNFKVLWGKANTSFDPCNTKYGGSWAFSEPETRVVRDIMHSLKYTCRMYLSLHSNGRYLVYPWEYMEGDAPSWEKLRSVANAGSDKIYRTFGYRYKTGSAGMELYTAAGGSMDYAYGEVGIPVAIKMMLPNGGARRYDLDRGYMLSTAKEAWVGIKAMASASRRKL